MQRMISVTVILEVDPVRVEEFLPIVKAQAEASRAEPGCLRFEVSQQLDKPNVFALSEMYEDRDAVEAHYGSEHFARWKASVSDGIIAHRTSSRGLVIDGAPESEPEPEPDLEEA